MKSSILIVDDETLLLESLKKALSREGYAALTATSGLEALRCFEEHTPDLVLLDVKLPDIDGIQVLQRLRKVDTQTPIVIMTAYSGIKGAVEDIKFGAYDYIAKPFDIDELKFIVARSLASRRVEAEVDQIRSTKKERYSFANILTVNERMKQIIKLGQRVANNSQSTVLISGVLQGLGAELVFAIFGYKAFSIGVAALAGALSAPLQWGFEVMSLPAGGGGWYAEWVLRDKVVYLGAMMLSGAVIAGVLGSLLVRALARAGALSAFPPGQEHRESHAV